MAKRLTYEKVPLSALDKFIYVTIGVLGFGIWLGMLILFGKIIPDKMDFSDESIVARHGYEGILWSTFTGAYIAVVMGCFASYGLKAKQPIVGNKKFKPKFNVPIVKTYPLFSRSFRENLTQRQRKRIRKTATILLCVFTVFMSIIPFGIYHRKVLDDQNTFKTYNSFNRVTHQANVDDAERLVIKVYKASGKRRAPSWHIEMKFVFEEKSYKITCHDFGDMDDEDFLRHMISLKSHFDKEEYECKNLDMIQALINYQRFTAAEKRLVYELFDYTP